MGQAIAEFVNQVVLEQGGKMAAKVNETKVSMTQGDITKQGTDAIVNAANSSLMGGGGVDGAIHRAGGPAILEECKKIIARQGGLPTGKAVMTTGGNLKARYVIHTVGPIWHGGNGNEAELLRSAYRECLKLAGDDKLSSIAFPSISTGAYGYPVNEAARIAVNTVFTFLKEQPTSLREVLFVLFDSRTYQSYCSALEAYLNASKPQEPKSPSHKS
jgi:O-acetyl-ADP-ribose deacetylase (regulator of RNase III)